jgi:hypothetical protein
MLHEFRAEPTRPALACHSCPFSVDQKTPEVNKGFRPRRKSNVRHESMAKYGLP